MIYYKKKPVAGIPTVLYRCFDPVCTHKVDVELLPGKKNRCTCGEEFILTKDDLRRKQPKCKNCANTKDAVQYRKVKELLSSLKLDQEKHDASPLDDVFMGDL